MLTQRPVSRRATVSGNPAVLKIPFTGTISGGSGGDWLDYSNRRTSVNVNLSASSTPDLPVCIGPHRILAHTATSTGGVNDIENVKGGSGNDVLFGDSRVNKLYGLGGDDILYGGPGADELYGGADDDLLIGGTGVDLLDGGSGRHTRAADTSLSSCSASSASGPV